MIYLDNAATTLMKPPEVTEAVAHAMGSFGGVGRGMHAPALAAAMAVYDARAQVAQLFGAAAPKQVAFTSNATEALNLAIEGLVRPGDRVITTAASHNSVLRPLYRKQTQGAKLDILPISPQGAMDYDALEQALSTPARLMVLTHASNLTGDIYDVSHVATLCRARDVILIVDAAQTGGHVPLDMRSSGIDVVVFTGHKGLFGPQGTGGLCLSEELEIPPYKVGGSGSHSFDKTHPQLMPESLEAGTPNAHGIAGLSAGVDYIHSRGVENIARYVDALTTRFAQGLIKQEGATVYGGRESCGNCGIVAFNIEGFDASQLAGYLDSRYGICMRAGAHCAPLMHGALGTQKAGALRCSFSVFNTEADVDATLDALAEILEENH